MENILVVIIFIVAILYNLYTNYKKEMEKSAKRRPQVRPQPIPVPTTQNQIPKRDSSSKTWKQENITTTYSNQDLPDEVRNFQQRRKNTEIKKVSTRFKVEEEKQKVNEIEFDLRQAVIQSVILERPYK